MGDPFQEHERGDPLQEHEGGIHYRSMSVGTITGVGVLDQSQVCRSEGSITRVIVVHLSQVQEGRMGDP